MRILIAYYFMYYLAMSVFFPYFSLYFSDKGYGTTGVGLFLSLVSFVGLISQPVMGMINDRLHDRRSMLLLCAIVSPVAVLSYYWGNGYIAIITITIFMSWFASAAGPLSDALAIEIASREGVTYGSVRLWGALSFSLGTFVTGFAYKAYGYDKSVLIFFVLHVFVVAAILCFPKLKPSGHRLSFFNQAKRVFTHHRFLIFTGISFLLTLATTVNFSFLPIYFKEMNFDTGWIGAAYTISALVEVPVFWYSSRLNRRFGRRTMLAVAASLYAVKCLVLAISDHMVPVLAVQVLEGIAFAFFAGAAVETVDRFADDATKASFQTIFATSTGGLGGIIGTAAGGVIVDQVGVAALYFILFILCAGSAVGFIVSRGVFHGTENLSGGGNQESRELQIR